jgi:hypoxanthine phosphoribosyltransferase
MQATQPFMRADMHYDYEAFCKGIDAIAEGIRKDKFKFEYIIGVARGGLIPATVLAYRFKKPILLIEWSNRDSGVRNISPEVYEIIQSRNVLLVDDILDSGLTVKQLSKHIGNFKTAALVYNMKQEVACDYYHIAIDRSVTKDWVTFWWDTEEIM